MESKTIRFHVTQPSNRNPLADQVLLMAPIFSRQAEGPAQGVEYDRAAVASEQRDVRGRESEVAIQADGELLT